MLPSGKPMDKVPWSGAVLAAQPWIELTRSYDERYCKYAGFALRLRGQWDGGAGEFLVRMDKATHRRHQFHTGQELSGRSIVYYDQGLETSVLFKTTAVRVLTPDAGGITGGPPFRGIPPELTTYQERGFRRLDPAAYWRKCEDCMWACRMPVTLIVDNWNPIYREYRAETFCFGPKECSFYQAGEMRAAPGRHGEVYEELDWVDEDATSHRGPDD
jgi:hypothetical protein